MNISSYIYKNKHIYEKKTSIYMKKGRRPDQGEEDRGVGGEDGDGAVGARSG